MKWWRERVRDFLAPIRRGLERRVPPQWQDERQEAGAAADEVRAPSPAGPSSPLRWHKELRSVLRARGRSDRLPEDLDQALKYTAGELKTEGARLVRASLDELIGQVQTARESESRELIENRTARLAARLDGLWDEWCRELAKAAGDQGPAGARQAPQYEVHAQVMGDMAALPTALRLTVNARTGPPDGMFLWTWFSATEVAIGALQEVARIRADHGLNPRSEGG